MQKGTVPGMGTALKVIGLMFGFVVVTGVTVQAGTAAGLGPEASLWLATVVVAYLIYKITN
jgi:hypothetical protein